MTTPSPKAPDTLPARVLNAFHCLQASTTTRDEPEDEEEGFFAEAATATGFFFLEEEADTADFLPGDLEVRDDCVLAIFSGMYEDGFCEGFIADDSSVFILTAFYNCQLGILSRRGRRGEIPKKLKIA